MSRRRRRAEGREARRREIPAGSTNALKANPNRLAFFAYYRVFMRVLADYGESHFCQRPARTSGYW